MSKTETWIEYAERLAAKRVRKAKARAAHRERAMEHERERQTDLVRVRRHYGALTIPKRKPTPSRPKAGL